MKYSELKKLLKKAGCRIEYQGANHEMWYCPKTEKRFPVGRHNTQDVKNGTLRSIMKAAGIE